MREDRTRMAGTMVATHERRLKLGRSGSPVAGFVISVPDLRNSLVLAAAGPGRSGLPPRLLTEAAAHESDRAAKDEPTDMPYESSPKHKEPWQRGRRAALCPR